MPAYLCCTGAFGTQKLVELILFYRRTVQNKPHLSVPESAGREGATEEQGKEANRTQGCQSSPFRLRIKAGFTLGTQLERGFPVPLALPCKCCCLWLLHW